MISLVTLPKWKPFDELRQSAKTRPLHEKIIIKSEDEADLDKKYQPANWM